MSVLSYLTALAADLKIDSIERSKIDTSISNLSYKLGNYFGSISQKYVFGSYERKTILKRSKDSYSDVDYMVVFSDGADYKPQSLLTRLKNFAEANYSRSEIYQSHPTLVLELNHIAFELVPAYANWWTTYIPAPSSHYEDWLAANPSQIKTDLETKNNSNSHQIRKLVRLLKYWNVRNGRIYSSYELERRIIDTSYLFAYNLKDYLFSAVNNLPTDRLSIYSAGKVDTLKSQCQSVQKLEADGYSTTAESEIAKVFS